MRKKLVIPESLVTLFVLHWNGNSHNTVTRHNINRGWCYQFALVIKSIYGGDLITSKDDSDHCWVRINGIDYDSDNLTGSDLTQDDEEYLSLDETIEYWSSVGRSGEVDENILSLVLMDFMDKKAAQYNFDTIQYY